MHNPRPLSLAACLARLSIVVALTFPLIGAFAYAQAGSNGLLAAVVAAAICWVAAALALTSAAVLRGPQRALGAMALGMIFRMGLPLGAGLFLSRLGGPLAEAGVFGLIVVFYLVTLVTETLLSLRLLAHNEPASSAS